MFRRILVTLDGSEFAEAALPLAAAIARHSGGELRLLTVEDAGFRILTESGWTVEGDAQVALERVRAYLEPIRERYAAQCSTVTTAIRGGYPADAIMEEADAFDADLIVMATHGRGAVSRLWLGSVANQCVRHGHRLMLLVRPKTRADAVRDASLALHRIVVPLDGSPLAERALGPAFALANLFGSRVSLMRFVHDLSVIDGEFFPQTVAARGDIVEQEKIDARAYLESVAGPMRRWDSAIDLHVAAAPEAPRAILEKAEGHLIVMATHARTGLSRAFLGSATEGVIHGAEGPVLVIPPDAPGEKPSAATAAPRYAETGQT